MAILDNLLSTYRRAQLRRRTTVCRKRRRPGAVTIIAAAALLGLLTTTRRNSAAFFKGSCLGASAFNPSPAGKAIRTSAPPSSHRPLPSRFKRDTSHGRDVPCRRRLTIAPERSSQHHVSSSCDMYYVGRWGRSVPAQHPASAQVTEDLSRLSYELLRTVGCAASFIADAAALVQIDRIHFHTLAATGRLSVVAVALEPTSQRTGVVQITPAVSPVVGRGLPSGGGGGGGGKRGRQSDETSADLTRRRRARLDFDWPESPGQEVPFEFAGLNAAIDFPCTIQLVQRVERKSLVYVNGTEVARRNTVVAAATTSGRASTLAAGIAISAPTDIHQAHARREDGAGTSTRVEQLASRSRPVAGESTTIRLVGEMAISRPAYLQVRKGTGGKSDTLMVSQFGLARGGSVSSLDLNPSLTSSDSLLNLATTIAVDGVGAIDTARLRPKPRLTGTVTGPLLWPNEVNQVPPAALLRLSKGKNAELRYLALIEARKRKERREYENEQRKKAKAALRQQTFTLPRPNANKNIDGITGLPLPALASIPTPRSASPMTTPSQEDTTDSEQPRSCAKKSGRYAGLRRDDVESRTVRTARDVADTGTGSEVKFSDAELQADGILERDFDQGLLSNEGVLVADGFLMPGKADGGVYIVVPADKETGVEERTVRLTGSKRGWFYHKAVWLVLPGGKKVVLTARVHKPLFGPAEGELVLLEMPRVEKPLAEQNLPWREIVLVEGPDVMFEVMDLDPTDTTVEVICAEFFGGRLTMHSISGPHASTGGRPAITESWVLDDNAGPAYAVTAADLRGGSPGGRPTHLLVTTHECTYDNSLFPPPAEKRRSGPSLSGIISEDLVRLDAVPGSDTSSDTSDTPGLDLSQSTADPYFFEPQRRRWAEKRTGAGRGRAGSGDWGGVVAGPGPKGGEGGGGGALLAYEIPQDWRVYPHVYPSPGWRRRTLASGFRVRGLSINPGAPGFPYVFHPHKSMEGKTAPYIALAGDCSQSAYILRPTYRTVAELGDAFTLTSKADTTLASISYEVACAIDVPGTVGSLAVSYAPLLEASSARNNVNSKEDDGWAKLFVPNYDGNRIYVFSMEPQR